MDKEIKIKNVQHIEKNTCITYLGFFPEYFTNSNLKMQETSEISTFIHRGKSQISYLLYNNFPKLHIFFRFSSCQ